MLSYKSCKRGIEMSGEKKRVEQGLDLVVKFNDQGLVPVVTVEADTNEVLMVANMNEQALRQTLRTGKATYYSRSRKKLWIKGEQSGHLQKVVEILVDCDQDCLLMKVKAQGGQCHTGYRSCFYRRIKPGSSDQLEFVAERVFDPDQVYGADSSE